MNIQRILAIILLVSLSSSAQAKGESVDETIDAKADGFVEIHVVRGEVDIRGWDKAAVRVVGTLDEKTKEFVFEVRDDETEIRVKIQDRNSGWFSDYGSNLTVYIPVDSQLDFSGVSTDVDVRGVNNSVEISVVSGDLFVEGAKGRVDVQSVSGDVELRETSGRLRVKSVSGDLEAIDAPGDAVYSTVSGDILVENGGEDLRLESVSGDIEVHHSTVTSIGGHSVSGDIDITVVAAEKATIEFDTVSGSIRLNLEGELNARFNIETGSGTIRNRVSDDKPKESRYKRDETLRFTLGDGDGQVILTTRSGDISINPR